MTQPILYVAITNHGFGHATRTAAVVAEIQKRCPDILIILVTTAPRWLLDSYISNAFIHRPRAFDIGVVQSDSVTMDKAATLDKLRHIRARQDAIIASEVEFIHQNRVGLMLADIPPLAAPIARAAGIPCWMMSNFGWDLIYRDWGGEFVEVADWIGECFSQCDRLFRLPFHEPMTAFPTITDVGLTGGNPKFSPDQVRERWNITTPPERTVLLTFGGLGLAKVPYDLLQRFPDWQFIVFDANAPDLPNVRKIGDRQYRPVDVMPLCGRIVSKPGYSTFAEASRLGIPIVSIEREGFAEAPFLIDGIRRHAHHQILEPRQIFEGNWEFLDQELTLPQDPSPLPTDGNGAIAQAIMDYLQPA